MPKERKGENFYSVYLFQDPENVLIGLNYKELQKSSTHYKHSLYNQRSQRSPTQYNLLRIAESKCSTPYITYTEQQKSSAGYNLLGIARRRNQKCSFRKDAFRNFTKFTGKQLCQSLFFNKVAGLKPFSQNNSMRLLLPSRNVLRYHLLGEQRKYPRITYPEYQKYPTPYNLLRIARFYWLYRVILGIRTLLGSSKRKCSTLRKPWDKVTWVSVTLHGWLKVLLFQTASN